MKRLQLITTSVLALALAAGALGCTAPQPELGPLTAGESNLELAILEPARGTVLSDQETVLVRGTAWAADGPPSVTVHGYLLPVAADGSFSFELPVQPGLTAIETIVRDGSGNAIRDIRGVIMGTVRPHGEALEEAFVTHIGRESFDRMAELASDFISDPRVINYITPFNPVVDGGESCFGITLDVASFATDSFDLQLVPQSGGLRVTAQASELAIGLNARTSIGCTVLEHNPLLRAPRATLAADFRIGFVDGRVDIGLENIEGDIDGMFVEAGVDDDAFSALLDSVVEAAVSTTLSELISEQIETTLHPLLRQMETEPFVAEAMGLGIEVDMRPRFLDFDDDGALFKASIAIRFPDHPDSNVVYSPATLALSTLRARQGGFQLGVADDVVNNFLSVLWSTGSLITEIPIDDPNADLFNIDHLEFEPLLPPVLNVQSGTGARLEVTDCMVRVVDEAGSVVAEMAVAGSVGLVTEIGNAGQVMLDVVDPDLSIGLIGAGGKTNNTAHISPWMTDLILAQVTPLLREGVNAMPRLRVQDIAVLSPSIDVTSGYLVMGANLTLDGNARPDDAHGDEVLNVAGQ